MLELLGEHVYVLVNSLIEGLLSLHEMSSDVLLPVLDYHGLMLVLLVDLLTVVSDAEELLHHVLVGLIDVKQVVLIHETLEAHVAIQLVAEEDSRLLVLVAKHLHRLVLRVALFLLLAFLLNDLVLLFEVIGHRYTSVNVQICQLVVRRLYDLAI